MWVGVGRSTMLTVRPYFERRDDAPCTMIDQGSWKSEWLMSITGLLIKIGTVGDMLFHWKTSFPPFLIWCIDYFFFLSPTRNENRFFNKTKIILKKNPIQVLIFFFNFLHKLPRYWTTIIRPQNWNAPQQQQMITLLWSTVIGNGIWSMNKTKQDVYPSLLILREEKRGGRSDSRWLISFTIKAMPCCSHISPCRASLRMAVEGLVASIKYGQHVPENDPTIKISLFLSDVNWCVG